MSENTPAIAIGIVAIITALASAGVMLCKVIRKSDCFGIHVESRTPPLSQSHPPTPILHEKEITIQETNI